MNLAIDIGNSRAKVGFFAEDGTLTEVWNYSHVEFLADFAHAKGLEKLSERVKYIGVASVGKEDMKQALVSLADTLPQAALFEIDYRTPLPIRNGYASPKTLGIDRLCSAVGAYTQTGQLPLLVIDAGTAITYDYVDVEGVYQGGGISPGIRTRYRALHDYTAALPYLEKVEDPALIGDTTANSIHSGVVNGVLEEIRGIVARYNELPGPDLSVFLTGGDAEFLGNHLKNLNFVDPNLLLSGIHSIILFNAHA
ncbi:MAG: type III pantothenate kinase [Bacteroidota bacterium]